MKKKKEEEEKAQRRALREEKKKEREMIQLQQKVNTSKKGICNKKRGLEADWLHIPHSKKFCLTFIEVFQAKILKYLLLYAHNPSTIFFLTKF